MTPPRSIVGTLLGLKVFRSPLLRRVVLLGIAAVFVVLAFFPEKYRAAETLTPTDPSSLGLSTTLNQLGAAGGVFGSQTAVELTLKVARSQAVRMAVAQKLNLPQSLGKSALETDRWLESHVDVRSLRGGIIQVQMDNRDGEFARRVVRTFGEATRDQLAQVAREQTAYKRKILLQLVDSASDRLANAQAAYDSFRLTSRYSSPVLAINALGDRIPQLEADIRAKNVELNAAREFGTDQNMRVRQIRAEIDALNSQLQQVRSTQPGQQSSVGRVVKESTQVEKLKRELDISQALYDNYKRFLQGTAVEDLAAFANVRVLEPAYIDTERQFNSGALVLAGLFVALLLAFEFYALRPPVEDRSVA